MDNHSMTPEQQQEAELIKNYVSGQLPAIRKHRAGCLAKLFWSPVVGLGCLVLFYAIIGITDPWAFHIGGRSTPFLTWQGYGQLHTKDGKSYPLYVSFFPSSHSSHLHLQGLRPVGGLQGRGWLCTSPGNSQFLDLSGTIYGKWRTTDGSLMDFRLLEHRIINTGGYWGFFDLRGRWQGPKLVMQERGDHGEVGSAFRSGLRIDYASVTLNYGTYSDFKNLCANYPAR
ncbi:MAG TPA: hypothetical protein VGR93_14260 [Candidatus Acidoferrales bacterium]|nr:hypothetical protein [Candidatus Acidoferrales bacterium]